MYKTDKMLEIQELSIDFHTYEGVVSVLSEINLDIYPNKWTGVVGETGCGKTMTALSILQLLPKSAKITKGKILFMGENLFKKKEKELQKIRGKKISMVFQDPNVAVNPAFKIGTQLVETIRWHQKIWKVDARNRAYELLEKVGLDRNVFSYYPHELSGGMLQRVMIALAISCEAELIIADEPTTALDVTTQKEILILMKKLGDSLKKAVLLISHDLILVYQTCDFIAVMYAGQIAERGPMDKVIEQSLHPYTKGLIRAIPTIDQKKSQLEEIPGNVPSLLNKSEGCPFFKRCPERINGVCEKMNPQEVEVSSQHYVRCHLFSYNR